MSGGGLEMAKGEVKVPAWVIQMAKERVLGLGTKKDRTLALAKVVMECESGVMLDGMWGI